jgi:hypothetical protein
MPLTSALGIIRRGASAHARFEIIPGPGHFSNPERLFCCVKALQTGNKERERGKGNGTQYMRASYHNSKVGNR